MTKSDRMRAMFAKGQSVSEVSRALGVDYAFAYGVAKRAGYASTAAHRRGAGRDDGKGKSAGPATQSTVGRLSGHGPRAPRMGDAQVRFEGAPIQIVVDPARQAGGAAPRLTIEGAQWLAETFFRRDPSATGPGSYDAWIDQTQADAERRDRIVDEDITAINRTMATRSPHKTWAPVVASRDWAWLEALDRQWRLFDMTPQEWSLNRVPDRLAAAFGAIQRKGLGIAVTTKVLHIKRPALVPVLDSLVLAQIDSRTTDDVRTWVIALESARRVGRANIDALNLIRRHLVLAGLPERTLVRILDGLLWTASPGSNLFPSLEGWEHTLRPPHPGSAGQK
jgi:hypothetical protein